MKKSTAYKLAQQSVLIDDAIPVDAKLFILALLMDDEKLAAFTEEKEN
jgi:hypothetical protein